MTPTQTVVATAAAPIVVTDETNRRLVVKRLTALDTLRLFKAAGPVLAHNQAWLSLAMLAVAVVEIDGVPVPTPANEAQVEALVDRLGEVGLNAIADAIDEAFPDPHGIDPATVGNLPGTPT